MTTLMEQCTIEPNTRDVELARLRREHAMMKQALAYIVGVAAWVQQDDDHVPTGMIDIIITAERALPDD